MFTRFPSWFLVNGSINCVESSKNVRAISCHHPNCSWKQAACKAKKLNTIMTQHAGHIHTRHKRQNAHGQTHSHMHTHTNTNAAYAWQNIVCSWFLQVWQNSMFLLAGFQLRFCKRVLRSFPCLDSLDYSSGPSDFARWCVWLTLQKGKQPFCKTVLFSAFWANSLVSQKYDPFSKYTTWIMKFSTLQAASNPIFATSVPTD